MMSVGVAYALKAVGETSLTSISNCLMDLLRLRINTLLLIVYLKLYVTKIFFFDTKTTLWTWTKSFDNTMLLITLFKSIFL